MKMYLPDAFTLTDRDECRVIAGEFRVAGKQTSAEGWETLATKIEKVLVGEYVVFTALDVHLVQALHVQVLKYPLAVGAKARSRFLTRVGVMALLASRGKLAQMR